ncbi:MAG: hypothetical protein ACREWG_00620 [Gammaproteobacteria bacterium]
MYSVRGESAATAATADHAIAAFWNPHASQRIKVVSFALFKAGGAGAAGDSFRGRRITVRGTAGSTVTPGIAQHSERGIAPPSGVLLDLAAFTGQPTLDTVDLGIGWTAPAVQGAGIVYPIPGGIVLGPGAGIALIQVAATAWPASEITFSWLEDWM